ncbi:MAG TPA: bifunctional glutamate N-acetyltransferase/amino-acid acetyltransferase ArgJ, partial [Polyangia bacterium]|nr:bifunctional glutamate N-acetyltransferase/amino-acid acetyltransferase ArgJ [Polyangia bacterium]
MTIKTSTSTPAAKAPVGFRFGGVRAGIKKGDRPDLAVIVSDTPCTAAGSFTVNKFSAAPVRSAAARLPGTGIRAIIANSGNANALTGPDGERDDHAMAAAAAAALGVPVGAVVTASTGAIGVRLPVDVIKAAMPALVGSLGDDLMPAAEAIRTTDLRSKVALRSIEVGGVSVKLAGIAKGSGMIHPQMATMLSFIVTDAAVSPAMLQSALADAVEQTFNTITVDGDMSTNDCVIGLANGRSGAPVIEAPGPEFDRLRGALIEMCGELARAIAADGEGATKLLIVDVAGVSDVATARDLARAVAGGSLVKAGLFGGDPSWGRILAALGARCGGRGFPMDPNAISLDVQGTRVFERGAPRAFDNAALSARMREVEISVGLDLGAGPAKARALGCDLSYDYVKINAEYYGGGAVASP